MKYLKYGMLISFMTVSNGLQLQFSRRDWMKKASATSSLAFLTSTCVTPFRARAEEDANEYKNPDMPIAPEERSGLVVLRVAEVAQFQEKIIRAVLNGDIDTIISPQQIVFGTQILLRNSNIAGNMKLMIDDEIMPSKKDQARQKAANVMNILQNINITASKVQRPFEKEELEEIADMYRDVRVNLNLLYEYLPQAGKDKYYGYFVKVNCNPFSVYLPYVCFVHFCLILPLLWCNRLLNTRKRLPKEFTILNLMEF